MHLFTNKAREKKYMHMESDVWIKEQQNTPLLQSGENIQSLKNTGYWTCKTISKWNKKSKAKLKQSNAWQSNSVPNVYKNVNHRVNHFKSNLSWDIWSCY